MAKCPHCYDWVVVKEGLEDCDRHAAMRKKPLKTEAQLLDFFEKAADYSVFMSGDEWMLKIKSDDAGKVRVVYRPPNMSIQDLVKNYELLF